jgi:hypothetical protein
VAHRALVCSACWRSSFGLLAPAPFFSASGEKKFSATHDIALQRVNAPFAAPNYSAAAVGDALRHDRYDQPLEHRIVKKIKNTSM